MNIAGRFPHFSALLSGLGTVNRFLFNILRTTRIPSLQEAKVPHPEQSEGPLVVQKKERPSKFKSSVFDHFPVWTGLFCEN